MEMENNIFEGDKNIMINLQEINNDNILDEELKINGKDNSNENKILKYEQKKRLKYTEIFNEIKSKDFIQNQNKNEFLCNILLMPSKIDLSNKINALSQLTYCYKELNKYKLIYNIARKFENKYIDIKAVDPNFLLQVFFKASQCFNDNQNYIYALKYITKAIKIAKKSNINKKKVQEYIEHKNNVLIRFRENLQILKEDKSFLLEKMGELRKIVDSILNQKNDINPNDEEENLYVINKIWLNKLNDFLKDYSQSVKLNTKEEFVNNAFEDKLYYAGYWEKERKNYRKEIKIKVEGPNEKGNDKKSKKHKEKKNEIFEISTSSYFTSFPGPINNFEITDYKDVWIDEYNLDENYLLIKNIKLYENFYLINKKEWNFLNSYFGSTNEIIRKKNNLELIRLKFILFNKRISVKNNNTELLKFKYIQLSKDATISQLKEKLIYNLNTNLNINDNNYSKKIIEEKNNNNLALEKPDLNDYEIYFYTLDKEKKDLLIEIIYSYIINNNKYDSLYIDKLDINESTKINDLLFELNKNIKMYLIVEVIEKNDHKFFEDLKPRLSHIYRCTICNKKINNLSNKYNCEYCNFSLFCSKNCADDSKEHKLLDECLEKRVEEAFQMSDLLSLKFDSLLNNNAAKGRVGLINMGNTCYLNSSLQCLSNTEILTKYFLSGDYSKEINNGNLDSSKGEIAKAYYNLINMMWKEKHKAIPPQEFRHVFCKKEVFFQNSEQHDSQEFLFALLNDLHDDLNRVTNKKYEEMQEKQKGETDLEASNRYWEYHKSRENSIIVDLFQGQYKSIIRCLTCGNESISFDTYMNLQLPIPEKKMQNQIKFFLSNGKIIYISIKLNDYIEIKDLVLRALQYIDYNKYMEYLTTEKISNNIFNYNNSEIPQKLLYNNIIVAEFSQDLKMTDLYKTSYDNSNYKIPEIQNNPNKEDKKESKNKSKIINNNKNEHNIHQIPIDRQKLINIYEKNKNREIVLFEKNMNSNDENNIDIFIYPITEYKKLKIQTKVVRLTYPAIITVDKNTKLIDLKRLVIKKFSNIFRSNIFTCFPHFSENWNNLKISNKKCPICGETYNKTTKYCLLSQYMDKNISDLVHKIGSQRPLILFVRCKKYDPKAQLYKGLKLRSLDSKKEDSNYGCLTIYDSLELFLKEEILGGEEKWKCNKCNKAQKASKKFEIFKTPYYLIVQLKRFKQRGPLMNSIFGAKNSTFVDYKEILNLNDFVVGPDKEKSIYYLYGVVIHLSLSNEGGHYISFCKNNGEWLTYNDKDIELCQNPIHKDAYLLFYRRKGIK